MFVVSGSGVWTPASAARSQVQGCAHRRRSETLGTGVTADIHIWGSREGEPPFGHTGQFGR